MGWENSGAKQILLGECKWGLDGIDRQIVRELIERKTPKVMAELPGDGANWQIHYAFFSRGSITSAALSLLKEVGGLPIDLKILETGLDS